MSKLQNQMSQVGQNLRNVGRTMSLAVTAPIVGIGAAAVKAASDVEEMQSKFDTVFKNVGGDVRKEVNAFASAVGRSRFELQGMTAELGDIFKPLGFTEERAGDLAIQMTKLAVDLGSFNNMPMNEALERLRGTLIGSHENALRFGVVINENVLKQELARMGADKLTGAQKEQAKVQARLNLLLAGTTDAQGDALRTSDSFANQMERLKNNLRDTGATIGQLLLPHALKMVEMLNGAVSFVRDLSPQMQRLGIIIAGVAAAAGPLVFSLGGIASAFSSILRVLTLTMGLFNPWVAGIAAAAAIGAVLYKNWEDVEGLFGGLASYVKVTFGPMWDDLKVTIETAYRVIGEWWTTNGPAVLEALATWLTAIGTLFSSLWSGVKLAAQTGLDAVETVVGTFFGKEGTITGMLTSVGGTILTTLGKAYITALTVTTTNLNTISAAVSAWTAIGTGDWDGAWEAVKSVPSDKLDGLRTIIQTWRTNVEDDLDTNDGKDLADELTGSDSGFNFATYISNAFKAARDAAVGFIFDPVAPDGKDSIFGAIEKIEPLGVDLIDVKAPTMPEITMPDWETITPTEPQVSRMYQLANALVSAKDTSYNTARYVRDIASALDTLGIGPDTSFGKFVTGAASLALDVANVVQGFSSLVDLLKMEIWGKILNTIIDIGRAVWAWAAGTRAVTTAQVAQNAFIAGNTAATGGLGQQVTTAAGAAGAGLAGALTVGGALGILGWGLAGMLGPQGPPIWEGGNVNTADWGNLAGAFGGTLGSGVTGLNFGSGWLSGAQFGGGAGRMAQTINVVLDGQTIATSSLPYMAQELELRGTNY